MMSRAEVEWWAYTMNVEVAWCMIPGYAGDYREVEEGVFGACAIGHDGTRIRILLSIDEALKVDPDALAQVQMVWLGKALTAVRRQETMAGL